jgi:type IV secretion system protein VirB1
MSPALSVVAALALARQCAPGVAPETMVSIAKAESALQALAVHDNTAGARYAPETRDAAIALATKLTAEQHHNVDLGLMQVNSANLATVGLSIGDAFDACRSMRAGAALLSGAFHQALRAALSTYNTGDPQRGIANGYVARVEAAITAVPPIGALASSAPPAAPAADAVTEAAEGRICSRKAAARPSSSPATEPRTMLGNIGTVLQQLATALTTGTIPIAVASIAIAACGYGWAIGRISAMWAASVVLGIAVVGAAATLAPLLVSG